MYWHPQIKKKHKRYTNHTESATATNVLASTNQEETEKYTNHTASATASNVLAPTNQEEAQNYTNDSESESRIEQTVSPEMQGITN